MVTRSKGDSPDELKYHTVNKKLRAELNSEAAALKTNFNKKVMKDHRGRLPVQLPWKKKNDFTKYSMMN